MTSSSQPFLTSSPLSGSVRRRSKFTYKHLSQLALYSASCPLRVIAHVDLDAFYAQCEQIRLGLPEDQPLAVQQWQGLIAINYPARACGLTRFITISDAQRLCPDLIMQHVATWKEGDEKWAYHPDAWKHIATHKVSLDPYRMESRKILACIKENLPPAPLQRVEKASVDEVYLDLSAQIHSTLLERYPELNGPPPYDDPTENLPRPPTTALDWAADALVDLDAGETEDDDPDWDDIAILIGSEIVRDIRATIRNQLKYTCSAGIGRNKTLAKLGSSHNKPNRQTVIRNRAAQNFLRGLKFTKIRNLGGKLGDEAVSAFGTDTVAELLEVPLDQVKKRLGEDTGTWFYNVIRGEETSEVSPRTQIKSMLSAKSFRPSINTFEAGVRWLRIFVADIFGRLVEEGVLENKRRPKTMNLHHRQSGQTRSRQAPISLGKAIDEPMLFDLAKNLLAQVVADGRAWPCSNLSLSVGGFEDGVTGNKGIGGFLVRGDEALAIREAAERDSDTLKPSNSKRRVDSGFSRPSIQKFFARREDTRSDSGRDYEYEDHHKVEHGQNPQDLDPRSEEIPTTAEFDEDGTLPRSPDSLSPPPSAQPVMAKHPHNTEPQFTCARCQASIPSSAQTEHDDWHLAQDLQAEERQALQSRSHEDTTASHTVLSSSSMQNEKTSQVPLKRKRGRPPAGGGAGASGHGANWRAEKGQMRLAFGK